MDNPHQKILLIGAGKMGGALLASWIRSGISASSITVVDPSASHIPAGIKLLSSLADAKDAYDCIVLAVKPQMMGEVLPHIKTLVSSRTLILSIAAGKTLGYFEKQLGDTAIVRAMPNTPAMIGKGISALIANARANDAQKKLADSLLKAAGETVWLEGEAQMDAVTALSGSGPAYVFLFLDALIEAGVAQGLPTATAKALALQTLIGSTELAKASPESLEQLRKNVTSPGGTTEAALKVLMKEDALMKLLGEAVIAAAKRAKELA